MPTPVPPIRTAFIGLAVAPPNASRDARPLFESLEPRQFFAAVPIGFSDKQIAVGLASPTAMAIAPDGRIFVCEQTGALRVIENGKLLAKPFLTVSTDSTFSHGLLGVAFDPNFSVNHYVYIHYTSSAGGSHQRISRFTADGDVAAANSEKDLFDLPNNVPHHLGGAIHFGTDGKLYIPVGDDDNHGFSQSLSFLFGKVLRINSDGSIPSDNPYYNTLSGEYRAIWASGLRNPFTFAVQPTTGRMFINDVGEAAWEEIDEAVKGANYGWPVTEGYTTNPAYQSPLFAIPHVFNPDGGFCIAGGAFYNPGAAQFPAKYVGQYFFADYVGGWIHVLDPVTKTSAYFADGLANPTDLQVGPDGSLYYLARGNSDFGGDAAVGLVGKISYTGSQSPTISADPTSQLVSVGHPATFTASASGTQPITYQWFRNDVAIPGATAATYTLAGAALSDNGAAFRVKVTNAFGSATSNAATLTVTSAKPPIAAMHFILPSGQTTYIAGNIVNYSAIATDAQDGKLRPAAFTWRVDFHHDTHLHPFIPDTSGYTSGTFTIPTNGETSAHVWYRINLTVKNSAGLTYTTYRDIFPFTSTVRLRSNIPGLSLDIDDQPRRAPTSFKGVAGIRRTVSAAMTQSAAGRTYQFVNWSDGRTTLDHVLRTPSHDMVLEANYKQIAAPVAINAGGSAIAAFASDTSFFGGTATSAIASVDSSGVPKPAPASAYQSQRNGDFAYRIPNLLAGARYKVRLHFAENAKSAAGERFFNVSINEQRVLENFDIYAAAGARNRAVVRAFAAKATVGGKIILRFTGILDTAQVNAVELIPI